MSLSPIPRGVYPSVTAISPAALAERGIKLVLADLDNTLVPYKVTQPPAEVIAWKEALEAHGIQLFLLSNSRKPGRAQQFAEQLGIPFQGHSGKPKKAGYLRAMERMGAKPEETVMVGDQIFTDTLGANNAGVTPLLVEPIRLAGNPGRYIRYAAETPFRLLGKKEGLSVSAKFGPAGNCNSFFRVHKSSLAAPKWIADFGLDCYEYQCGKGVHVGKETAVKIGENARAAGISLSIHAPYFINLANPNPDSIQKNNGYVLASCALAEWMGAARVVVHTGALMGRARREALDIARRGMSALLAVIDNAGLGHIALCPETMGKINQLGDLDEVLELCTLDERLVPCIDFGHLYARSLGADDGPEAMRRMLDRVEEVLGSERASAFHSHFSHIEFTPKGGEKCHRTFADDGGYGPDWAPLAAEIARRGWSPTFICESAGTQAEDALTMKRIYEELVRP